MTKTMFAVGKVNNGKIEYRQPSIAATIREALKGLVGHEGLINHSPLKEGQVITNGHRTCRITKLVWDEKKAQIYARTKNVNAAGNPAGNPRLTGYRPVNDLVKEGWGCVE